MKRNPLACLISKTRLGVAITGLSVFFHPEVGTAITSDELCAEASRNNLDIKKAKSDQDRSNEKLRSAEANFLPSVRANVSSTKRFDPEPAGSQTANQISLTASQNIFSGFADINAKRKAESAISVSLLSIKAESADVRLALKKLFNEGLYLERYLLISARTIARRKENVRIVSLRYNAGRENKSSLLKTEAATLQIESDYQTAKDNLDYVKQQIQKLTGIAQERLEKFEGDLADSPQKEIQPDAIDQHPKLLRAKESALMASHEVEAVRSGWYPQISADAQASRSGIGSSFGEENKYSIGLSLTVPIFSPSQDPKFRSAVVESQVSQFEIESTRSELTLAMSKAKSLVRSALAKLAVSKKIFEANTLQAQVYRQRYTLGLVSFQDWDAAEGDFIRSEADVLSSQRDLSNAMSELDFALGRSLEERS